jgi:hypothetical protein
MASGEPTDVTTLDPLGIRRRLGRKQWSVPEPFGPDGWIIDDHTDARVIVTAAEHQVAHEFQEWWHASISRIHQMPSYEDLALLHAAVWPDGWAYQLFTPPAAHVNIHEYALHLWGRPDGRAMLPNFGEAGSI